MINELESLYRIKNIQGIGTQDDKNLLSPVINEIIQRTCVNDERPDIRGNNFGIEHTEISPFFEHKKKGDNYRRFNSIIKNSLKKMDFPFFEYHFLDLASFKNMLGIKENNWLAVNIVKAINEKSNKFLKYEKFDLNGLWISFPTYLSFNNHQEIPFLLQESIFSALMKSPFEFFLFGNENLINIVTKKELIRQYKKGNKTENIVLSIIDTDEFPLFQIKCKALPNHMKSECFKMGSDIHNNFFHISKDLNVPHCIRVFLESEHICNQTPIARLYSDDVELEVIDWKHEGESFTVNFSSNHLSGKLVTNFMKEVVINFTDLELKPNECIKLTQSQHNDSLKQKILTGTKRFVLYTERRINIYTTPPCIRSDFIVNE